MTRRNPPPDEAAEDTVARDRPAGTETPRRYDKDDERPQGEEIDDAVMPSDDPTLKTNI